MNKTYDPQLELYETCCSRYDRPPLPMRGDYDLRDRLDIVNLLTAYGHLFDGGYRDAWIETIFAPDIEWTLLPFDGDHAAAVTMNGRDEVRAMFAGSTSQASMFLTKHGLAPAEAHVFHQISDICVVDQADTDAHVVARQFVGVGHESLDPSFQRFASVLVEGQLTKRPDAGWQVRRWQLTRSARKAMGRKRQGQE